MSKVYQVRVLRGGQDGSEIQQSTSVYADSEMEARLSGAAALGVSKDRVVVEQIPDVWNPSDAELRKEWSELGLLPGNQGE